MMKILHLLSTNSFSGAENVVCQIISMYSNEKNVTMIYCSPDGKIREKLLEKKIEFLPLEKLNYASIKKAILKYKPDVIHAHDIKASICASLFSKNIEVISHIHGNSLSMRKVSLKSILFLLISKKMKHIFWVSNSSLTEYRFYNKVYEKSSILVNVVDKKQIIEKSEEINIDKNYDAIFVGRLVELKNPMRLLNVFSSVVNKIPTATLAIVGTGDMEEEMKKYISENKLDNNVFLLGFQSNPYIYIKKSKMMLLTSIYEGTPMCALEALCLGKPIISTPTDGMVDLINQNMNGFLSDDDQELSDKICKLIVNKEELSRMTINADKESTKTNNLQKYKKELDLYYK
ncbi:MAG: glycosyltransferase [Bacilli bacterium]